MRPLSSLVLGISLGLASYGTAFAAGGPDMSKSDVLKAALAADGALHLAPLDLAKIGSEDAVLDGKFGVPVRYGIAQDARVVDATANPGAGAWTTLPDGRLKWQIDVVADGARTLDFAFSAFRLPHGAELRILSRDSKDMLGPYTDADNRSDGRFYTPLLAGRRATVELILPADKRETLALRFDTVNLGYRDPFDALTAAKSGSCNIDTICPQGNGWRDQIASVAHYTYRSGTSNYVCTGQLMATGNRAADVSTPRLSTAHHCVSTSAEAESMVFYWGYESPTCRTPGSTASGQSLSRSISRATQNGAQLLATTEATDWTAVQLLAPVPAAAGAYYSGWDRSGSTPPGSIGIHHPAGHEKRITFNDDPLETSPSCIVSGTANDTHWYISEYESGTTEGGSSGSGLWRSDNKLLVGVLSGGNASCSAPDQYDCYGRLSVAWEAGGSASTRMRDHFDRSGANPVQMQGAGTCDAPTVTLSSAAFTTAPSAGQTVQISAAATGGSGSGYSYAWDLNGDDGVDQRGSTSTVTTVYNTRQSVQVRVVVTDGAGCSGTASRALDIKGPALDIAATGTPVQVCGNGDATIDPGERWRQPLTVRNSGNDTLAVGARALFAGSEDYAAASCTFGFVDIANGANAAPLLPLTAIYNDAPAEDEGSVQIALGGGGVLFDGQRHANAVMSTNGYVSFSTEDTGGDYDNGCNAAPDRGSVGPLLRAHHRDLIVGSVAGAGLRYRYFATCPRTAAGAGAGCHVFQWSRMQHLDGSTGTGDFEFQALVYDGGQVTYQYKTASPDAGASATIGFVDADDTPFDARCNSANAAPAQSAICLNSLQGSVRPESPTLPLQPLAAGAQMSMDVTFAVPASAACGAPLGIDYVGAAGTNLSTVAPERVLEASVGATCTAVTTCPAQVATIDTREGLFYNPNRPGNGLASYSYGGGWYTAEPDRNPIWYPMSGSYVDNLMRMPLNETVNNATPPNVDMGVVQRGDMWLARVDATRQLFAWRMDDGRAGAELMTASLAPAPRPAVNRTETWFSPQQLGWGLVVESAASGNNTLEAFGAFIYDAAGKPRWVLGTGTGANGTAVNLAGYRPHCPGCPWLENWSATQGAAGTLTPTWTGNTGLLLNTAITLPAPLQGTWNRTALPMQPILPPAE